MIYEKMYYKLDAQYSMLVDYANITHGMNVAVDLGCSCFAKEMYTLFHLKPGNYCTDSVMQKGSDPLFAWGPSVNVNVLHMGCAPFYQSK